MKIRHIPKADRSARLVVLLLLTVGGLGVPVFGQETPPPEATPAPTPTPVPTPVPETEIPDRAAEIGPMLREAVAKTDVGDQIEGIATGFAAEKQHLSVLKDETAERIEIGGPASIVEEALHVWQRSEVRLDGWLAELKSFSSAIAEEKDRLEAERRLWELTRSTADKMDLPEALRLQVDETIAAVSRAENAVRSNRDEVLTLQSEVAREKAAVDEMIALQREEISLRRRNVIGIDSLPLWKTFNTPGIDGSPSEQMAAIWTSGRDSIVGYVSDRLDRLIRQGIFLVVFAVFLVFLRRRAELWSRQDRSLETTTELLNRPVAAAFIVTALLGELFHPNAPQAWLDFLGLILLLAVLRVLPILLSPALRPAAFLLALIYLLDKFSDFAPDGNMVNRVALLLLAVVSAASCRWLDHKIGALDAGISDRWRSIVVGGIRLAFAALVVSALANLIGAVGFSGLLLRGVLQSIYSAVLFWVAAMLLQAIVRVFLLTRIARNTGLVRLHADTVRQTLFRLINVFCVVGWTVMALLGFGAADEVVERASRILKAEVSIGDFSLVPGDIVIFFLLVWITFKLSQLLRFVLETDVMPHMDLPRGVPGAVSRLSHYAIVVVGVMIAATAAGLDFSRINLIIGALGVGIGFGLQNVVNNFVSGLILLFERPIRVGDKVQLDQVFGTVKDIGMRASVVRTFQGAEVIVPNANLISAEVTNWTLSDERRRLELPVGVAYGTDPETVIEILIAVAGEHPDVLSEPQPQGLFLGFGESSLDFQLRAWTRTDFVRVSSELLVAVNRALADEGIEIPFPQRDLHLRSVDSDVAGALGGGDDQ